MYCGNCSSFDIVADYGTGDVVCYDCGMVQGERLTVGFSNLRVPDDDGTGERSVYEQYPVGQTICVSERTFSEIRRRASRSPPYKRLVYYCEKLRQWSHREPEIPDDDFVWIESYYEEWCRQMEKGRRPIPSPLRKQDIQYILHVMKRERGEIRWTRKYFERWFTIRKRLTGYESAAASLDDDVFDRMILMFQALQRPFYDRVKGDAGRKSFPSIDYTSRRLLDILQLSEFGEDLLPLKGKKKRIQLNRWWQSMTSALGWPYINNDWKIFPGVVTREECYATLGGLASDG